MGNFHLLLAEAIGVTSLSDPGYTPSWMTPDFSFLDHPEQIREAVDEHAARLQEQPFTTEDLLLDWFPVLDKCWVVSERQQRNLNDALFDAGYFPVGTGLNTCWHWAEGQSVKF